jgi:hypothetical protein
MKKIVIATLAAFLLGTTALSSPAEARCWWNGFGRQCSHPHPWYHHHYWGPSGWRY